MWTEGGDRAVQASSVASCFGSDQARLRLSIQGGADTAAMIHGSLVVFSGTDCGNRAGAGAKPIQSCVRHGC